MAAYEAAAAIALYLALACAVFGASIARNFTEAQLGHTTDPSFLMWAMVWWPYAITHRINPFICKLVWAPAGVNLAWSGGIPLAALAAAPLTAEAGPVASYNALMMVCPVIAAWSAYLLCRHLTRRFWPSLLGGYLFGFSSYMLGQAATGHLNLIFVFPAPLLVLIVLRRIEGAISATRCAMLLALTFATQFMLSIELATTEIFFGAIALAIAWLFGERECRERIVGLAGPIAAAMVTVALILSPYLYFLLALGVPRGSINSAGGYAADVLNLIVPTPTVWIGALAWLKPIASRFRGHPGEPGAYLSIPTIAAVALYAREWRGRAGAGARVLTVMLAAVVLLAVGPRVHFAGATGFGMPWKIFMHFPLIKNALPVRFMSYAALIAAIMVASWTANETVDRRLRCLLAILIVAFTIPRTDAGFWSTPVGTPEFFRGGLYREYLREGETVVAIPYGISGKSMMWQASTAMYFRMAGGYTGMTPREFQRWPIVSAMETMTAIPDAAEQMRAFMAAHGADAVIVDEKNHAAWADTLAAVDPRPTVAGGVWLYRVPLPRLAGNADAIALEMERRDAETRFAALAAAARRYLAAGGKLAELTPMRVEQLGLIPPRWAGDWDERTPNGLYLGPWESGRIAIGVGASYPAVEGVIAKYRGVAAEVYYPFPEKLEGAPRGDTFMRLLVIVFDRAALARVTEAEKTSGASARK